MQRNKCYGTDAYEDYTYYNIIDFNLCVGCEHFHDNKDMCRFECDTETCDKIDPVVYYAAMHDAL